MDHISTIDINNDSSFLIALEAQKRGFQLFHYEPKNLFYDKSLVYAKVQKLLLKPLKTNFFSLSKPKTVPLSDFDVILMRQDPPFDMSYIAATHLLDLIDKKTIIVNNPTEVRNAPEKLFMLRYPHLLPPTLITQDITLIEDFRKEHHDIIIKPLFGNGGAGVFHINKIDENLNSLIEMFVKISKEPLMIQKYIPEVRNGDKRIILINGVAKGATNRIPKLGEARSNMHVGGRAEKTKISDEEYDICAQIGPDLKKRGLVVVGIDVIGGYLTEINVTSPTGIHEINAFNQVHLEIDIWNCIEDILTEN